MRRDGSENGQGNAAVYAELRPVERHRSFIDHLFILRDRGQLTGPGRNLFASPFSEIVLVGRCANNADASVVWKAAHLPPRFGRQPRRQSFHGWMLGIRCRPRTIETDDAAIAGLSDLFTAKTADTGECQLDPIVSALDAWIDHLRPRLDVTTATPEVRTRVASLAATIGVAPRTLQRHVRNRTGLAPKRYAAVQRFNEALRQVALGSENLAHIASEAGYSDQAHLTTDLGRHAGLSPGRFRALARRQIVQDAVRFFKDADLQNRVRLLVCDSGTANNKVADGEIRSERCKLRDPCPDEFRAPGRDGNIGH